MYFSWKDLFFAWFVINTVIAIDLIIRFTQEKKPKIKTNYLVYCVMISSVIWSSGMGIMSIQQDEKWIYIWRVIGIFGTFMFMMSVQKILCTISELPKKHQIFLNGVSYFGLVVFFLYITPGQTVFVQTDVGTTFYFTPGPINVLYSLYFVIVPMNIFFVSLYMIRKHKLQRIRVTGRNFMIVEFFVLLGALGDMVMPSLGIPAIPGSAITQTWGVFVFYLAIHEMHKSQITVGNMSSYIYYSLDIPVLIFDADKKLQIVNDAASNYFKVYIDEKEKFEYRINKLFNLDENMFDFEEKSCIVEGISKYGHPCQLAISKIENKFKDVVGYIIIVNDMTEQYNTIAKLEEAKMQADAANMSKSLFLANMSHEIRTPMNAILGFSDIALQDEIDEKSKEYFSDIRRAGTTLLALINDVLNISKIELGKGEINNENYKTAQLFKDVELIVGIQAQKKNLEFKMNIDQNYPDQLYGDKDKLREIMINILNNSVKYTKSGGITFDVALLETTPEGEALVQYKVTDTGIGIKPEEIGSIFDKFKRVDEKANSQTEGTGLGLSITKGLIELMGGTINVESTYGEGTTFTVELKQKIVDATPIHLNEKDEEKKQEKKQEMKFVNVKFLAVDDNKTNLKVISSILKKNGIPHELAESGPEAIEMCKANQYDIIFMDHMMPVMDGVEAMKHIRKLPGYSLDDSCRIIALTANVIEGVKEELLKDGFNDFLGKPIDLELFKEVLKNNLPEDKIIIE